MRMNDLDIASLSGDEAQAFANYCIRSARSRRYEADLLGHIASALTDTRGLGHAHIERIGDFVRAIVRDELKKRGMSVFEITIHDGRDGNVERFDLHKLLRSNSTSPPRTISIRRPTAWRCRCISS
jgi:hypothetical protein